MLFDDSCIACAGTGATLDVNGVCQCANFATLIDNATDSTAVCQCNTNYLPFIDACVMCYGVGAVLENDVCKDAIFFLGTIFPFSHWSV